MKVSIVGSGNVGATAGFLLSLKGEFEVVLFDIVEGLSQGKSLDMMQASSCLDFRGKVFGSNDFKEIVGSDVVVITAGFPRSPGMSREDLFLKNGKIVKDVAEKIKEFAPESVIIVVTNPLDEMTYLAHKVSGFDKKKVLGMGGALDTARFRYFLAQATGKSASDVSGYVIGSHNDLMVPVVSSATISGLPVSHFLSEKQISEVVERTRKGGAEIVSLLKTGSAFYAPAASVFTMVKSILEDRKEVISTCTLLEGEYGASGVFLSVPARLGKAGLEEIVKIDMDEKEKKAFKRASEYVRESVKKLRFG